MRFQVVPASVDLYMPFPWEMLLRMKVSPVPAQTTFESDGAIASEPTEETGWLSKIGAQEVPPSVDLKIPPEAAPA